MGYFHGQVVQEALETEVANLSKALCFDFGDTSAQFMGPGQVEELLSGTKWNHREKKELNNLLQVHTFQAHCHPCHLCQTDKTGDAFHNTEATRRLWRCSVHH